MLSITHDLTGYFVRMYNNNAFSLGFLVTADVPKKILLRTYDALLDDGVLTAIEDLPEDEKIKLVDQCRATGEMFTNESLTDAARILHAVKLILDGI